MLPADLKARLTGVLAFAPTPFTEDDRVDLDGLGRHVDQLCRDGVGAIVIAGGVGEFYALDAVEHRACVAVAVEAAAGRVPVIAGVGHSTAIACRLASAAAEAGADGLMVNPLYFITPELEGLRRHYAAVGAAAGLGLIAFSTRSTPLGAPALEQLAAVEQLVALKDENGDLRLFVEAMEALGDRLVWINGMAELLAAPYFGAGAAAMTSGIVNFAPELVLALWDAGAAGRLDVVRELVATRIRPLARLRELRPGYHVTVVKEAMNLRGLPGGQVRPPLVPLALDARAELEQALARLDLLVPA